MTTRTYSSLDRLLMHLDTGLRTVFGAPTLTERPNPAQPVAEAELSESERRHVGGLMRVNTPARCRRKGCIKARR